MTTHQTNKEFTREELYDLVWKRPVCEIAKEIGISDVGLVKLCRRHHIPLPGRGYWQKLKNGKTVVKTTLPKQDDHGPIVMEVGRTTEISMEEEALLPGGLRIPESVTVPTTLENPRPEVKRTQKSLLGAKVDEKGLVQPRASQTLGVHVSKEQVPRAMHIMEGLLNALADLSIEVTWEGEQKKGITNLVVLGENVPIALEEKVTREIKQYTAEERKRRQKQPWVYHYGTEYEYHPTGRLVLKILSHLPYGQRRSWGDGKRARLEDGLVPLTKMLFQCAVAIKEKREERERWEREWQEEQRRRYELARLREEEEKRVEDLWARIEACEKSGRVRVFLKALMATKPPHTHNQTAEEFTQWLTWANGYADWLDPTIASPPSILDTPKYWY